MVLAMLITNRSFDNCAADRPKYSDSSLIMLSPPFPIPIYISFMLKTLITVALAATVATAQPQAPIATRWTPDFALPLAEHPRPSLVRDRWVPLNGQWDYAITPASESAQPSQWQGKINVPFPLESTLSGVTRSLAPDEALWYRRELIATSIPQGARFLLHFGAVDHSATVWINSTLIGTHEGGYTPFTFDITDALAVQGVHEIIVRVTDPTDTSHQARGKQVLNPHGIWYTAVSGIWQTVWLEAVPETRIERLDMVTHSEDGTVKIHPVIAGLDGDFVIEARVRRSGRGVASGITVSTRPITLHLGVPDEWSPDSPALYEVEVALRHAPAGEIIDRVQSYFAFRTVEVKPDAEGIERIHLNGQPLFMLGLLDQGWWPDGLYTAPTDEALKFDVQMTRALGFNMLRKHVKVEPARFYFWCDQLGVLVWQDMPSGDKYIGPSDPDIERTPESETAFRTEWQSIIDHLAHHPSIVAWIPFNEGWGQFKTNEIINWTKSLDPTRLVGGPSGWTDRGTGDFFDVHVYPGPGMAPLSTGRASVLGEFGGLGLPVEGHLWQQKDNWGYRTYSTRDELKTQYEALIQAMRPLIGQGLAAAVYTQTTDVEGEVNGLMTYDRRVIKIEPEDMRRINALAFAPPPIVTTILPTSEKNPQPWRTASRDPGQGWYAIEFRDHSWSEDIGGFGTHITPGARIGTEWKSADIWLRRTFTLPAGDPAPNLYVRMHHDEDATVYLNGKLLLKVEGYTTSYRDFGPVNASLLRYGTNNVIAVHCRQTRGGQFIDVGLVSITEPE